MKVGAVDADKHQSLGGQYGVRGFPTIKIFGANKNKAEDYQGKCDEFLNVACLKASLNAVNMVVVNAVLCGVSFLSGACSNGETDGWEWFDQTVYVLALSNSPTCSL